MSILGVNDVLAGAYQYANRTQKTVTNGTSFTEQLQKTGEAADTSKVDTYTEYLKQRYGANVMVKNIGNDQRSIDNFGASIAGYNNVAIAPNILEKMANDPEKAAYYEQKIQKALADFPKHQAIASMNGFEVSSYAVGIDEKGVVYKYLTGDLKPEVRAKIEAKVRAEQEEKRARREKYQERSKEAAEERKQQMEIAYRKQAMAEAITNHTMNTSRFTYTVTPEVMSSAVAAYENNIMGATGILE